MKKIGVIMDNQGLSHQICSIAWADKCWIMSHSKTQLKQMMMDLIEEAER